MVVEWALFRPSARAASKKLAPCVMINAQLTPNVLVLIVILFVPAECGMTGCFAEPLNMGAARDIHGNSAIKLLASKMLKEDARESTAVAKRMARSIILNVEKDIAALVAVFAGRKRQIAVHWV
jgi:hypothetical protein